MMAWVKAGGAGCLPITVSYADTLPNMTPSQLSSDGETPFERPQAWMALNYAASRMHRGDFHYDGI